VILIDIFKHSLSLIKQDFARPFFKIVIFMQIFAHFTKFCTTALKCKLAQKLRSARSRISGCTNRVCISMSTCCVCACVRACV